MLCVLFWFLCLQWRNLNAVKKAEYEARAQMQLGQGITEVRSFVIHERDVLFLCDNQIGRVES